MRSDNYGTPWTRQIYLIAGTLAIVVALIWAALALKNANKVDQQKFAETATGSLLAVAGAALITGVVGAWASAVRDENLDRRKKAEKRTETAREHSEKEAEIAREHRAFLESQIVKLWDLHDRLKTAAVLIAAHRTAKTYGEQVRAIIEIRTQLSDVSDTVGRRLDPLVTREEFEVFRTHVERATKFLHPLVDEFRRNYLNKVSYKQRLDEAANKKLDEEGVVEPQRRSTLAWDALKVESDFPGLQKLIHFGELSAEDLEDGQLWMEAELTEGYLEPLRSAIDVLVACRVGRRTSTVAHEMRLTLDQPAVINDANKDALAGAFGDDLVCYSTSEGPVYINVERTAATLHDAVSSALSTLVVAIPAARVVRVEIEHKQPPITA